MCIASNLIFLMLIIAHIPNIQYFNGMTIQQVINFIINSGVEFDELINEKNKWVHISFSKGKNKKKEESFPMSIQTA